MKRNIITLALVVAWLLGISPVAAAPTSTIQVLDQSIESHFPDELTFRINARSDTGDIVEATLYLQVGWNEATELVIPEPFTPASEVELTAVWNTASQTVPPFIEIVYHWQLRDSSGATVTTEPVYTEYTDDSQNWQRLESEKVIILWYERPDSFGQQLFQSAQEAYDHVAEITGATTERPIRVVIYNNQADFCSFYPICEDWVGGQTFSGITVQWGTDPDWFIYDVVPHELAHVFYGEIFEDTWVRVPTWFNEGIAVYNERSDHQREINMVKAAAESGELRPLAIMTRGGGVSHGDVGLWYAVAYSLVAYISDAYGEETLGDLILTLASNVHFEEALVMTTGLDMAQLEMEWRDWLGYPIESVYTPIPVPTMPTVSYGLPVTAVPTPAEAGEEEPEPAPTDTPAPAPTTAPEAEESESPMPGLPCLGLIGLLMPMGALGAWSLKRRQRQQ